MRARAAEAAPIRPKFWRHLWTGFGSLRFYLALAVAVIILHTIDDVLVNMPVLEPQAEKEVTTAFQVKKLEIWSEMNKLVIAFATVTIGAIGGFMLNRDKAQHLSPPHLRRAAMSWLFCALSLYFGYLSYQQGMQMLRHGVFNPLNARLWWPARAQFWSFLISIILFGEFIYTSIRDKRIER
jgi:hypothetical protein